MKSKSARQTIQYLLDHNQEGHFIYELQEYLKKRACHFEDDDGNVHYGCDCDPEEDIVLKRKKHFINFCNRIHVDWMTADSILSLKMSRFISDCDLINNIEIDEKGRIY